MDDGERDDLVAEVADALTLDQDVDWDRCRRQAVHRRPVAFAGG